MSSPGTATLEKLLEFSRCVSRSVRDRVSPTGFAREVLDAVVEATECAAAALWVLDESGISFHEMHATPRRFRTTVGATEPGEVSGPTAPDTWVHPAVAGCAFDVIHGREDAADSGRSAGRVLTVDVDGASRATVDPEAAPATAGLPSRVKMIPLQTDGETIGALALLSPSGGSTPCDDHNFLEAIAQSLGLALSRHASRSALRERVKELSCLYAIVELATRPGRTLSDILGDVVQSLPAGWQYPDVTVAQIVFDGLVFRTPGFDAVIDVQTADIVRGGCHRGRVEVGYTEGKLPQHEGPFLRQERKLIDAVADKIGLTAERLEAHERRTQLESQVRHADRLATIGQLAAGVAHELNEPLANILGYAQLAQKAPELPEPVAEDLKRVVSASLYARDIIRTLLLFARPEPPALASVDPAELIDDVLGFLEARSSSQGVTIVRDLAQEPLRVNGDRSQLRQVLVNLLVNAAQAMPDGGRLTVRTRGVADRVHLTIEDTGVGMSPNVQKQVFLPFFTTKDVDQGTGLGLSVVHGIVTSHGGSIRVESVQGAGSRFEIEFPRLIAPEAEEAGSP